MRSLAAAGALLAVSVYASQGDDSAAYRRCVEGKFARGDCDSYSPNLSLRITRWSCLDDLRYYCMHELTDQALNASTPDVFFQNGGSLEGLDKGQTVQFHGKWPFTRFIGMQEPLSVLFSILNLLAHLHGYISLTAFSRPPTLSTRSSSTSSLSSAITRLQSMYKLNAVVGVNVWFWSSVFHTRDTPLTEKGDYFSAGFGIGFGLYLAFYRIATFYTHSTSPFSRVAQTILRPVGLIAFFAHCVYLSTGRFDYSYNMTANLIVGLAQILLWTTWSFTILFKPSRSRSLSSGAPRTTSEIPQRALPLLPLALLVASTAFEILDFAPIPTHLRLLDAHALWHLSTVGVVFLWYRFLLRDLAWLAAQEGMKNEGRIE